MPGSFGTQPDLQQPAPRTPRLAWLIAIAGVLLVVAVVRPFNRRHSAAAGTGLHAGFEEAPLALRALLAHMPRVAREPFVLRCTGDPDYGVRYAAVDALGSFHDAVAVAAIRAGFTDSSSIVRQRALEVMMTVAPHDGLLMVASALKDHDLWIRQAAIQQLVTHEYAPHTVVTKSVVPLLIPVLGDSDGSMVALSMGVLRHLTHMPWKPPRQPTLPTMQPAVAQWRAWWRTAARSWPSSPTLMRAREVMPTRVDQAPDFDAAGAFGPSVRLSDMRGKIVLLNFWGTWCGPCQSEEPALQSVSATYASRGVVVVGLAVREPGGPLAVAHWCATHGTTYVQGMATDAMLADYGHFDEVPVTLLVDRAGRIRYRWEGDRDLATFSRAIDSLLARP